MPLLHLLIRQFKPISYIWAKPLKSLYQLLNHPLFLGRSNIPPDAFYVPSSIAEQDRVLLQLQEKGGEPM